jgi:hypothetical protein
MHKLSWSALAMIFAVFVLCSGAGHANTHELYKGRTIKLSIRL